MENEKSYQLFVSPLAAEQIKKQLAKRGTPESYLRLGLRGGGCSGFSYHISYEDNPPQVRDLLFEVEGVRVIVDGKSILYLNGCTLGWEKTLMTQGFKFSNPNATAHCGCGTSFSV
jgi:iron-sulfur cluster assembly protein